METIFKLITTYYDITTNYKFSQLLKPLKNENSSFKHNFNIFHLFGESIQGRPLSLFFLSSMKIFINQKKMNCFLPLLFIKILVKIIKLSWSWVERYHGDFMAKSSSTVMVQALSKNVKFKILVIQTSDYECTRYKLGKHN